MPFRYLGVGVALVNESALEPPWPVGVVLSHR